MKIGMIGLGKLGLPVAVAMDMRGHDVMGYDLDETRMSKEPQPYQETGPDGTGDFNDWLAKSDVRFGSLPDVVEHSEIVFIAVQTPHDPRYEGITRLPPERKDFDYSFLVAAVKAVAQAITKPIIVAIISTVLPGTCRREITPLLPPEASLVYNPSFIAMGTTMRDFLDPEFVLIGAAVGDEGTRDAVWACYKQMLWRSAIQGGANPPLQIMSVESAELTKVAYNTYISQKIAFANTVMEICHGIPGADCDEVIDALSLAHRRLISPAYLRGGMGDGGGCHPRDNIAMSWLAQRQGLSHDIFDDVMRCREEQAWWLAAEMMRRSSNHGLPLAIYGYAFKKGTNLTVGSPALLIYNMLIEGGYACQLIDPHVDGEDAEPVQSPAVILIGCNHDELADPAGFPPGSIVLDPWRIVPDQADVEVIRIGEA